MRNIRLAVLAAASALPAGPALAAEEAFFSLRNTHFVVLIAFLVFLGVLAYLKVPQKLGGMLDKRAERIRDELEEARRLREEAQALLASYERRQGEIEAESQRIIETARAEAERLAEEARAELHRSVERRIASAEEHIELARKKVAAEMRNEAVDIAVEAAREVIAGQIGDGEANRLVEDSIDEVRQRLH